MIEAFVLPVLQSVLSGYIVDVLTKKKSALTRAEVVESIKRELSRHGDMQQRQIDALAIATRELEFIVNRARPLKWRNDVLTVEAPRRSIPLLRKKIDAEAAIAELKASIAARREELERAQHAAEQTNKSDDIRLIEPGEEAPPPGKTSWRERLLRLPTEVREARRKAQSETPQSDKNDQ